MAARGGAGRGAGARVVAGPEEVVEADLEQIGCRRIARDVPAELGRAAALDAVRAHHHRQRVPAHQRGEALLHREVARKGRLRLERDLLTYGVTIDGSQFTPARRACASSASNMKRARSGPCAAISASSASHHSAVSAGSRSSAASLRDRRRVAGEGKVGHGGILPSLQQRRFILGSVAACRPASRYPSRQPTSQALPLLHRTCDLHVVRQAEREAAQAGRRLGWQQLAPD